MSYRGIDGLISRNLGRKYPFVAKLGSYSDEFEEMERGRQQ